MSTIVTRAGKGSALTWTEGDANVTNLNNDKMESFTVAGDTGTSQSIAGGNTLTIAGGTNLNSVASATDTVTINLDTTVTGLTSLTSSTIVTDTITGSTANGPIVIAPDGTGDVHLNADSVRIGDNNADATLATRGTGDLILTTNEGAATEGIVRIYDGANGNITLTPNGTGKVIITNLQVDGTTTTVNSTTVTIDDPIFTLGGDTAPSADDNKDRGIEFRWHNGTSAKVGFFGFDDSTGYLTFIPDATNTSEVFSGTQGDIQATNFRGALVGNATTATTLATTRAIYGNNFDGSAALTQVIASTYGGTGNGFTKFSGPTTAERTFTLPDASSTILVSGGALGTPSSGTVTNLTGTASININGTVGATTAAAGAFTTLSASSTVSGTGFSTYLASPPAIGGSTAAAGTFTTMTATTAALKDIRETIYAIGNSSTSTLTPDAANGSIQSITATGNFTLSAFANPVSGQTITFVITQDATGSRTLTSTMKFAGASKTLSTAASSIDILTVSYIGTTYYASLVKGYA